ncbi:MAG TPA: hypothetical protein VGL53_31845 [Bryobacteraceae bacterium]
MTILLLLAVPLLQAQSYSVTTIAGTNTIQDGIPAVQAFLRQPAATRADSAGNIYVLDSLDARVRRIDSSGIISTVAGTGRTGFSGDSGPAVSATLNQPSDIALDRAGLNLYIADTGNHRLRQVDLTSGIITTIAGSGSTRYAGDGGPAIKAGMSANSVTVDASGNVYSSDSSAQVVRKVDMASGIITTFAGTGFLGYTGDGGPATSAWFNGPAALATDAQFLYISDVQNRAIRRVDLTTDIVATWAGRGTHRCDGDCAKSAAVPLLQAYFSSVDALSTDAAGNLLILDYGTLRYVAAGSSMVTGIAGVYYAYQGPVYSGDGAGTLTGIQFSNATGVAIAGANDYLIADTGNLRLRRISHGGIQTITGFAPPDGVPATSTILNHPTSAAVNSAGDLFIADTLNNRFRKVAASTGIISTTLSAYGPAGITVGPDGVVYGTTSDFIWIGITSQAVKPCGFQTGATLNTNCDWREFETPQGIRVDAQGALIFANPDTKTSNLIPLYGQVRRMIPATGAITTLAGNGDAASGLGENVPATSVGIVPVDVALDSVGNIYVVDAGLWRIRKIDSTTGLIATVAGGVHGNGGDGGPALKAGFNSPTGVTIDAAGNLFVADLGDMTIRRIDGRTGIITRIAGTGDNSVQQDAGAALGTSIGASSVLALPDGSLLVTDTVNDRIRKLTPQKPQMLTINAGDGQTAATGAAVSLVAQVLDAAGLPVAYVPVTFAVTSGDAQIANPTVATVANGTASAQVILGASSGTVTVRATAPGLASVTFTITVVPPFINSTNGISGLPMSTPPVQALSPNGLMQISGQGFLAGGAAPGIVSDGDLVNGQLPTVYQGICVNLSGTPAPLLAVSATQIIFEVPNLPAGGTADVSVTTACGSGQDVQTAAVTLPVQTTAPELFYAAHNSDGSAMVAVMNNASGQAVTTSLPGDSVTVYMTGLGATDSTNPGDVLSANVGVNASVSIQLGAETIAPDWLTTPSALPGAPYMTSIGENAGVYLVQFTIPADAPAGNLPIVITTGDGATSPAGAYITVVPSSRSIQ